MKVIGNIKDAAKEMPIANAKVGLYIREKELAVLYSDSEGKFEHKEAAQYIGGTLICRVQKEGFKTQEVSHKIEQEEVHLDIELVPVEEEKIVTPAHVQPPPSRPPKWPKIAIGIAAVILAATIIYLITLKKPLPPEIQLFNANPSTINRGQSSTLSWEAAKAKEIIIEPEIGNVTASDKRLVSPNQTTTYTLIARNETGEKKESLTVEVRVPTLPTVDRFNAVPSSITSGERSMLNWETSNTEQVRIEPEIGNVTASGKRPVSPNQTTTYTLIVKNEAGEIRESRRVEVRVPPKPRPPEIVFDARPFIINRGESSTLGWKTSNAKEIIIEPEIGNVSASGRRLVSPNQTTTYTLIARNGAGETRESRTVEVRVTRPLLPEIVFNARPPIINRGESSTLVWKTLNAKEIIIEPEIGNVSAFGKRRVSPNQTTTYTLIARNEVGETRKSLTVTVKRPSEPALRDYTRVLRSDQTQDALRIVSIKPGPSVTLKSGQPVTFRFLLAYVLKSTDRANVGVSFAQWEDSSEGCHTTKRPLVFYGGMSKNIRGKGDVTLKFIWNGGKDKMGRQQQSGYLSPYELFLYDVNSSKRINFPEVREPCYHFVP